MTTLSLRGDQPGSAEADGAQEHKPEQPETAEPPRNTYTCTAESLHAAKRKEKKMNGREIKQQHYRKKGGRDTVHKQTEKPHKKLSQQRNKARMRPQLLA